MKQDGCLIGLGDELDSRRHSEIVPLTIKICQDKSKLSNR